MTKPSRLPTVQIICIMAAAGLLLTSCAPTKPSALQNGSTPIAETVRVQQDESLDPLTLGGKDVITFPDVRKPLALPSPAPDSLKKAACNQQAVEMSGFRVQLYASDFEEEARSYEERALLDFNENVYLTFDVPMYKIRIGDCRTRAEANLIRQEAENKGYAGAWVVRCKVLVTDP
ncbi:MAG: SPOR domain-containing protein [bacterium]|nr:SPOR domain-containing protein [bacterium]